MMYDEPSGHLCPQLVNGCRSPVAWVLRAESETRRTRDALRAMRAIFVRISDRYAYGYGIRIAYRYCISYKLEVYGITDTVPAGFPVRFSCSYHWFYTVLLHYSSGLKMELHHLLTGPVTAISARKNNTGAWSAARCALSRSRRWNSYST